MLNLSHKAKRDLLTEMLYTRLNDAGKKVEVTRRGSAYDALGHSTSRTQVYPRNASKEKVTEGRCLKINSHPRA